MTAYNIKTRSISNHSDLINDKSRNNFFYTALAKHAPGKVVLDVGSGTGILSFYALSCGADFVYAIEPSPEMAAVTDNVLAYQFDRSKFKVINADFWTSEIEKKINKPIDVLVSEMVGPGLFEQGMIHTWSCVKQFASPYMISIPDKLSIDLWAYNQNIFPNSIETPLTTDNVIDQNFLRALVSVDSQPADDPIQDWVRVSELPTPDDIQKNIFAYSYDNLPNIQFSNKAYPQHIIPIIETKIDITSPTTIVLVNKISSDEETLYLYKTATGSPWVNGPCFYIETPGKYNLKYINTKLGYHLGVHQWDITRHR